MNCITEIEVFLDTRQRFEFQPAAVALKADEPAKGSRHHDEIGEAGAQSVKSTGVASRKGRKALLSRA
jgi:hypothetical protein